MLLTQLLETETFSKFNFGYSVIIQRAASFNLSVKLIFKLLNRCLPTASEIVILRQFCMSEIIIRRQFYMPELVTRRHFCMPEIVIRRHF